MQRINVVGTSGSGKSTFAAELSKKLGYPLVEIDSLHWGPNWTPREPKVLKHRLREALVGENWVLDGNYGAYTSVKWERATHVIWLDYPYLQVIWQITWRSIHRILNKTDLWGTGNRETLRSNFFSKESVILWAIQTHHENRRAYVERMQAKEYSDIRFIRLCSRMEADAFLENVSRDLDMFEK